MHKGGLVGHQVHGQLESRPLLLPHPNLHPTPKKNTSTQECTASHEKKGPCTLNAHMHVGAQRYTRCLKKGPCTLCGWVCTHTHTNAHTKMHTDAPPQECPGHKVLRGQVHADVCTHTYAHMHTHPYKDPKTRTPGRMPAGPGWETHPVATQPALALSPLRREGPPVLWSVAPQPAPAKCAIICPAPSHINCRASLLADRPSRPSAASAISRLPPLACVC